MFYRDITALVYCSKLDCLITASQELSIRVWGPDWELRVTFVEHNGKVITFLSLFMIRHNVDIFICV